MSAPQSPRERDARRQGQTDGVPMTRAMGSAAHAAAAVPEPPQAGAALAKAVDDSKPSEAHLRHLLDTLPILASCHLPDGSNAFCNQRWRDYTGLSPEEAHGWGWHVTMHPDDLGRVMDMWHTRLAAGQPGEIEARWRRVDGAYRWFLFRVVPLRDALGHIVTWYGTNTDIEDRKTAEEALRRSEGFLAESQRLSHVGSWSWHVATGNIWWSQEMYRIFNVNPDQGAPNLEQSIYLAVPEEQPIVRRIYERAIREQTGFAFDMRALDVDGMQKHLHVVAHPVLNGAGELMEFIGTTIDVTEHKRAESLLSAERRTLAMIASGASLTAILEEVCRAIDAQAPNIMSTVLLMDPDGKRLWPAAGPRVPRGWTQAITPLPIGPGVGSCGTAAFRKQPVIVADIATDPLWALADYREVALRHGLRAAWSQPILSKHQEVLGTFGMYYAEPRSPTDSDRHLITGAGHLALIAIEGERAQGALTKAFEEIKQSEAQLRNIIDTIPTLAWCSRPDGFKEFFNQRWHGYTGLSPAEAHGWGWQVTMHPEDVGRVTDTWRTCLAAGEPGEVEGRLQRFDGAYRWFLFRAEPLRDEMGHVVTWYGTETDIDDLKQAEARLRQDEQELRRIIDAIPQTIVVLGPDGRNLYANQAMLAYTGLTLDEVMAADFRARVFHPHDVERLHDERQEALARGTPFANEQRARRHDGQYRWFLIQYNPLRDDQGRLLRWYATGTDIDERKQAEERMRNENLALREDIDRASMFEEIVGSSAALRRVLAHVEKVAETDATVLILGETGTGKELMARAIHKRSNRATRAFIRVNCAAMPPALIASELFGHEKGAFTGALQRRLGRFEAAHGGTIFLDEIGDLPAETQMALLRVLQEREFERVGSSQPIAVNVRVLAATNRDLPAAVAAGTFRQDLFYRLNVFPI
jgi:formate hydrogenlyase transcriptional activator